MIRNSNVSKTVKLNNKEPKYNVTIVKHFDSPRSNKSVNTASNFPEIDVFFDNVVKDLEDKSINRKTVQRYKEGVKPCSIKTKTSAYSEILGPIQPNKPTTRFKKKKFANKKIGSNSSTSPLNSHRKNHVAEIPFSNTNNLHVHKLKDEIHSYKHSKILKSSTAASINYSDSKRSQIVINLEDLLDYTPSTEEGVILLRKVQNDVKQYSDNIKKIREELNKFKNKQNEEKKHRVKIIKNEISNHKISSKHVLKKHYAGDWSPEKNIISYISMVKSEDDISISIAENDVSRIIMREEEGAVSPFGVFFLDEETHVNSNELMPYTTKIEEDNERELKVTTLEDVKDEDTEINGLDSFSEPTKKHLIFETTKCEFVQSHP